MNYLKPFKLSDSDSIDLQGLADDIMERVSDWESSMTEFFGNYNEWAQSWRVKRNTIKGKPNALFNSKVGETHRGTEALATFWTRVMTASDPFFEAFADGLGPFGKPLTQEDLYLTEQVIIKQLQKTRFKQHLLQGLTSCGLFGTLIVERPWIQLPATGEKYFEATGFVPSPLIRTFFDPNVFEIEWSDYIGTIEYFTFRKIYDLAYNDAEGWDIDLVKKCYDEYVSEKNEGPVSSGYAVVKKTDAWARIQERKQRAGYQVNDKNYQEVINYHGKVNTENKVIKRLWESLGIQQDPKTVDFTVRILNGKVVGVSVTQYGNWRTRFGICSYKTFECEPLGYGVGALGAKAQNEMDITTSRMHDLLMMSLYNMWLVSKYAGLKTGQLGIKPLNMIEVEDTQTSLVPVRPDINAIAQALGVLGVGREDFRTTTGATSTLQAEITKATATESAIAQNEAVRSASVHGEIMAEVLVREHIEMMHLNNLYLLDSPISVAMTGKEQTSAFMSANRHNIPASVGFRVKIVTDKDFRPERTNQLLQALQTATSIRNVQVGANTIMPILEELFRSFGMNPRLLAQPMPMSQQLADNAKLLAVTGGAQGPQGVPGIEGDMGTEAGGVSEINTPAGPVATSPNSIPTEMSV